MVYLLKFEPRVAIAIQWQGDNLKDINDATGLYFSVDKNGYLRGGSDDNDDLRIPIDKFIVKYNKHYWVMDEWEVRELFTDYYEDYEFIYFLNTPPSCDYKITKKQ